MPVMRKCRGVDVLVAVDIRGDVDRFSLESRLHVEKLSIFGHWTFIENKNVHRFDRCLRGAVVATSSDVGYIIKAGGTKAVYQSVLPARGPMRLISLRDSNNIPLQQVGGPFIWDENKICKCRVDEHGYVTMDPDGCNKFHSSTSHIPASMLESLRLSSFAKLVEIRKGERTKLPMKVPVVYLLCTREQRHGGDEGEVYDHAFKFMLPFGNKHDVSQL